MWILFAWIFEENVFYQIINSMTRREKSENLSFRDVFFFSFWFLNHTQQCSELTHFCFCAQGSLSSLGIPLRCWELNQDDMCQASTTPIVQSLSSLWRCFLKEWTCVYLNNLIFISINPPSAYVTGTCLWSLLQPPLLWYSLLSSRMEREKTASERTLSYYIIFF